MAAARAAIEGTSAGAAAAIPAPAFGASDRRLVINEIMAAPRSAPGPSGQWLEVHNWGTEVIELRGWRVASSRGEHVIAAPLRVVPGGYAVLARAADRGRNGGVRVDYSYGDEVEFGAASGWVALRDPAERTADSTGWRTPLPAGAARGVTDPSRPHSDPTGANWHTSAVTYGAGDRGTPGARNDGKRMELLVHVLDAGNADAIYIENGRSRAMLDAGHGVGRIDEFIREVGLAGGTLDLMLISHAHIDHYGGMRAFFRSEHGIGVRFVFENADPSTSTTLAQLRDSVIDRVRRGETTFRDTDDPCNDGRAVCTITLDGGAKLHVMRPRPTGSANNRSFAAKLVGPDSASFTMWLSGDAEHDALAWFEEAGYHRNPGMDVHVLKGNHHGSCNGITRRFLQLTTPEWVTFGVSATNGYGHVHEQTKTLLWERRIRWYRSDRNGRITFRSPGTEGGGYTVSVDRGGPSENGQRDRRSTQAGCRY